MALITAAGSSEILWPYPMDSKNRTPISSAERVAKQLILPSEELLWSGRPRQGIVIRPIDYVLIPLSIFACCFFGIWSYFAIRYFPVPLKSLSIVAIGFGFFLAVGRFLLDMRRRTNTIYAITSERCLWINEREQSVVRTLAHQVNQHIGLMQLGSAGTIVFGPNNGLVYMYALAMGIGNVNNATAEFEMIEDGESVRNTIREVALKAAVSRQDDVESIPSERRTKA